MSHAPALTTGQQHSLRDQAPPVPPLRSALINSFITVPPLTVGPADNCARIRCVPESGTAATVAAAERPRGRESVSEQVHSAAASVRTRRNSEHPRDMHRPRRVTREFNYRLRWSLMQRVRFLENESRSSQIELSLNSRGRDAPGLDYD